MERLKITLACLSAALCWICLIMDWNIAMYAAAFACIIFTWMSETSNKDTTESSQAKEDKK